MCHICLIHEAMSQTPTLQELNALLISQSFRPIAISDSFSAAPYTVRIEFVRRYTVALGFCLDKVPYHDLVVGRKTVEQVFETLVQHIKVRTPHEPIFIPPQ